MTDADVSLTSAADNVSMRRRLTASQPWNMAHARAPENRADRPPASFFFGGLPFGSGPPTGDQSLGTTFSFPLFAEVGRPTGTDNASITVTALQ